MNQSIGYARVSSIGQSLEVQLDKLKDCDKVFQEKRSGKQTDNRPELLKALDYVREGDSLIISRLDRMAEQQQVLNTDSHRHNQYLAHQSCPHWQHDP